MAKPGKINYADALAAVAMPKEWAGGRPIAWSRQSQVGFPLHSKARAPLKFNGVVQEGCFIDLYHKISIIPGVPDKVSFSLMVNGARVMGLDENGPTSHLNKVGKGLAHFMSTVDHPHLHVPASDGTPGYADPIDRQPIDQLWQLFCARANIKGAPPFNFPATDAQLVLL